MTVWSSGSAQCTANTLPKETKHQGCGWTEINGAQVHCMVWRTESADLWVKNVTVAPSFGHYLRSTESLVAPLSTIEFQLKQP